MAAKLVLISIVSLLACNGESSSQSKVTRHDNDKKSNQNFHAKLVQEIELPDGFKRDDMSNNSFAEYLGKLALKKDKTVYLFNGKRKLNQDAQFAVIDLPIGNEDLQQCADAIMRIRAGYLFAKKKFNEISFSDNYGRIYKFNSPFTQENYENYLRRVFGMCGTASLAKQLKSTAIKHIKSGDVFIRGGFPGHAVIVMDVVINGEGKKKFMLAQSYMPAQSIHILKNPLNKESPWFDADFGDELITPEYIFKGTELRIW